MSSFLGSTVVLLAALVGADAAASATSLFDGSADLTPAGRIDALVFERLEQLDIQPAHVCSDSVFVRRVYLDVIGTLPTAREAREFLLDRDPNKRRALIDRLLERDEFADYWAMKWSDLLRVKAEFPINLWPNAAQAYHRWIRTSIKDNMPYDQFAREMLTANGSNFRVGPVNFYRAVKSRTPQGLAQAVALAFMGVRTENWPEDRLAGMAVFFSHIKYKPTGEWKEEIVTYEPDTATLPTSPGIAPQAVFPDGTPAALTTQRDPRAIFADWLIDANNPWFGRNIVNRVWFWLLGRGIIQEPDDIRPDNPPSHPVLLEYLEQELVASKYDLQHIYRLILNSKTYQLSSVPQSDSPEAAANFARYPLRRLEAEVLIDALNQITGSTEQYSSAIPEPFTYIPEGQRSIALPDGSITSSFLDMFGRPSRDTGLLSERSNRPTPDQRLHLLNSSHIRRKIETSPKLLALLQTRASARTGKANNFRKSRVNKKQGSSARNLGQSKRSGRSESDQNSSRTVGSSAVGATQSEQVVTALYLAILSRFPTNEEVRRVSQYEESASSRRDAIIDLAWALINSAEFLYRH